MGRTSHTLVYFLMSSGSWYDSDTIPSSDEEEMEDDQIGHWKLNLNPRPWSGTLADSHAWQMETSESLRGAKESSPPVPPD